MKAIDYKGKHFILQDDLDEEGFDVEDPYVDADKIATDDKMLTSHILDCDYYGIPPYLGKDEKLHAKIKEISERIFTP